MRTVALLYGSSEHIGDLCQLFDVKTSTATGFELSCKVGGMAVLTVDRFIETVEGGYSSRLKYGLFPLSWEGCCIGCCHYGFGKYCKLIGGHIPESPYSFHCNSFAPTERNLILYRRFRLEIKKVPVNKGLEYKNFLKAER